MSCRAWVNGITFENGAAAAIPVTDRGLAFGDGLFETIRVDGGRAVLLPLHMARLGASAAALGIACDISRLEQDVVRFVADCTDAVVKVILTRGSSGRGYLPDPAAAATLIFTEHPAVAWPLEWASEGIVATVCQQRLGISPMLAGHKHLNRLEQVVLRQELAACPEPRRHWYPMWRGMWWKAFSATFSGCRMVSSIPPA
jgi:4-amino-4-deoxychorismate lyase